MKFVKVDRIPKIITGRKGSVQIFIEEFYDSGIKMARIDIEEGRYKSLKHAQNTFINRNRKLGKLPIKTLIRDETLYIIRTDM